MTTSHQQTESQAYELAGLTAEMLDSLFARANDIPTDRIKPVATRLGEVYAAFGPMINRPALKAEEPDRRIVSIGGPFGATSKFLRHSSGFMNICRDPGRFLNIQPGSPESLQLWTSAVQQISQVLELAGLSSVVPERARQYATSGTGTRH